jgi:uncharacterized UBP type Zn finger protein
MYVGFILLHWITVSEITNWVTKSVGDMPNASHIRDAIVLPIYVEEESQMAHSCGHLKEIRDVTPSALGCEECLKTNDVWVHLRLCRTCGHVGCCDDSPNRHATKHFHATGHPIIEGYDPPEGWGWCYVDQVTFDLSDRMTPHNGPIPCYYI